MLIQMVYDIKTDLVESKNEIVTLKDPIKSWKKNITLESETGLLNERDAFPDRNT